jgi:hypothetical protein
MLAFVQGNTSKTFRTLPGHLSGSVLTVAWAADELPFVYPCGGFSCAANKPTAALCRYNQRK